MDDKSKTKLIKARQARLDREEEWRRAKRKALEDQVADGRLIIRQMTDVERAYWGPAPPPPTKKKKR